MTNNINNKMNSEFKFQDNQSCELSFNIDKALNNDKKTLLNNIFTERTTVKKVKHLCSIDDTQLQTQYWEKDAFNKAGDMVSHFKEMRYDLTEQLKTARSKGLKDNDFI